jgi:hypothetical protein
VITSVQTNYRQNACDKTDYYVPRKKVILVSLNDADTSAFTGLPAIRNKQAPPKTKNPNDKVGIECIFFQS